MNLEDCPLEYKVFNVYVDGQRIYPSRTFSSEEKYQKTLQLNIRGLELKLNEQETLENLNRGL